jgi:hypothetical protein
MVTLIVMVLRTKMRIFKKIVLRRGVVTITPTDLKRILTGCRTMRLYLLGRTNRRLRCMDSYSSRHGNGWKCMERTNNGRRSFAGS